MLWRLARADKLTSQRKSDGLNEPRQKKQSRYIPEIWNCAISRNSLLRARVRISLKLTYLVWGSSEQGLLHLLAYVNVCTSHPNIAYVYRQKMPKCWSRYLYFGTLLNVFLNEIYPQKLRGVRGCIDPPRAFRAP